MGETSRRNKAETRRLDILYEDEHLAVVYKPAGLLTVSYPGSRGRTAVDMLFELRRRRGRVSKTQRPAVVHRLDRGTSGVLLFALTAEAKKRLMAGWQQLVLERRYRALCEVPAGVPFPLAQSGAIDRPLCINAAHHAYVPQGRDAAHIRGALSALTRYRVLCRGSRYALLECELETGRKNQIRAHLASFCMPVAGDTVYHARSNPDGRLCLHARSLVFTHPFGGGRLSFEVPEPARWRIFAGGGKNSAQTISTEK